MRVERENFWQGILCLRSALPHRSLYLLFALPVTFYWSSRRSNVPSKFIRAQLLPASQQRPSAKPLFSLGDVVATPGALEVLSAGSLEPLQFILRHVTGDWDEMDRNDQLANIEALVDGGRIFS